MKECCDKCIDQSYESCIFNVLIKERDRINHIANIRVIQIYSLHVGCVIYINIYHTSDLLEISVDCVFI